MLVERGIINCRFFALITVAGSLLGSVLCFVEGSFLVIESYLEYFCSMSQRSDEGEVLQLLIEAIDIFLVGFVMLVFGTRMYVLFVATKEVKREGLLIPQSKSLWAIPAQEASMGGDEVGIPSEIEHWKINCYDTPGWGFGEVEECSNGTRGVKKAYMYIISKRLVRMRRF